LPPHIENPADANFEKLRKKTTNNKETMTAYKKIAVLGASGTIGRPIVKQLAEAGFDLTLISRDTGKLKSAFPALKDAKFVEADPADPKALEKAFSGTSGLFVLTR
jgi:uncharacterized protein YbjT (DUF2867 family)